MQEIYLEKQDRQRLREKHEHVYYKTKFNFLRNHNGFRKGQLHMLLGDTSSGKSTMVRSLISDHFENNNNKDVLLYLSEEKREHLETALAYLPEPKENYCNLYAISEQDDEQARKRNLAYLAEKIEEIKPSLVIIDNVTTMDCYDKLSDQPLVAKKIKYMAGRYDVPILLVMHTRDKPAGKGSFLLTPNDVKGYKKISHLVEFLYTVDLIHGANITVQLLQVHKARTYEANGFYRLDYEKNSKRIIGDKKIEWELVKHLYDDKPKL